MRTTARLRRCPFCGGEAELKTQDNVFGARAVRITCTHCHCSSNLFIEGKTIGFKDIPSRYVPLGECISQAINKWNLRAEELPEAINDIVDLLKRVDAASVRKSYWLLNGFLMKELRDER